jgi:arabinogalactan endo-1,4-beta-galactosidase
MANNETCPPIPTLDELLNSGNFIEVDVDELVQGEFVIRKHLENISCIEVLENDNPVGYIRVRVYDAPLIETAESSKINLTQAGVRFYRKINHRKDFHDITKKMEVRIRNYPKNQQLTLEETIFANKELSDNVGNFLGPPISGKGGRRKRAGTRRTRKNKRKSTRRTGRKYKK